MSRWFEVYHNALVITLITCLFSIYWHEDMTEFVRRWLFVFPFGMIGCWLIHLLLRRVWR